MAQRLSRRKVQQAYNEEHGITPQSTKRAIIELGVTEEAPSYEEEVLKAAASNDLPTDKAEIPRMIRELPKEMDAAAEELEFEKAAELRDRIQRLKDWDLGIVPIGKKKEDQSSAGRAFRPVKKGRGGAKKTARG